MTIDMRLALRFTAAAMFLDMAFASVASAQDAMQRDMMFRDSLQRRTSPQKQVRTGQGLADQDQRHDAGASRRHSRLRRHET